MKVLFIDNFDLFTYNLMDEFAKRNCEVVVYRNDIDVKIIENAIKKFKPGLIVISSGPGNPSNSGNSLDIIRGYAGKIPIIGIGLGFQCIIEAFNGIVDKAPEVFHGKPSKVSHDKKTIYKNIENPFQVGRYHSLAGLKIPDELIVSAKSDTNVVMGVRHKKFFVEGVQFHPESILTPSGGLIIENLLEEIK